MLQMQIDPASATRAAGGNQFIRFIKYFLFNYSASVIYARHLSGGGEMTVLKSEAVLFLESRV